MSITSLNGTSIRYKLNDLNREIYRKLFGKKVQCSHYAGRSVLSIDEGNDLLAESLSQHEPYMAARYGAYELNVMLGSLQNRQIKKKDMDHLVVNAGFFPNEQRYASDFGKAMIVASTQLDMAALFYSKGEELAINRYCPDAVLTNNRAIEPWYSPENPWTRVLTGKRVLVIHPFESTILKQYEKRKLLFPDTDILPEFELHTIRAVQTVAGMNDPRFKTWFEALDYMYEESRKIDFDIALIGCGAYGFPLAAQIKMDGRHAVHIGGALQLLFGIKGTRWDHHDIISKLYNDNWIRPCKNDIPEYAQLVEGGCYW